VSASRIVSATILTLALSGCFGGRVANQALVYDLGAVSATQSSAAMSTRPPIVLSLTAAPTLVDKGIIWRIGDSNQPRSYATAHWAASPAQLVNQELVNRLSREGPVLSQSPSSDATQLQVTLSQFEQVFATDGSTSEGCITLQAVLLKQRKVVGQVQISRRVPASTQDVEGGVTALRQAVRQAGDQLAQWLSSMASTIQK
jgi:cholesterol transport system auxiliary component